MHTVQRTRCDAMWCDAIQCNECWTEYWWKFALSVTNVVFKLQSNEADWRLYLSKLKNTASKEKIATIRYGECNVERLIKPTTIEKEKEKTNERRRRRRRWSQAHLCHRSSIGLNSSFQCIALHWIRMHCCAKMRFHQFQVILPIQCWSLCSWSSQHYGGFRRFCCWTIDKDRK